MHFLQVLGAAITLGSVLGAAIASLFAIKQKTTLTVLREGNKDYKDRVEQLEKDRDEDRKQLKTQAANIKRLEEEKRLPLQKLTNIILKQHAQQMELMNELIRAVTKSAETTNG